MEKKATPFDKYVPHDFGTRFKDMTPAGKWIFTGKLIACVCTFGFFFPNVQSD